MRSSAFMDSKGVVMRILIFCLPCLISLNAFGLQTVVKCSSEKASPYPGQTLAVVIKLKDMTALENIRAPIDAPMVLKVVKADKGVLLVRGEDPHKSRRIQFYLPVAVPKKQLPKFNMKMTLG